MANLEEQTITPEERGFMRIMAMAGQDLGISTLDAMHLNGIMAGIFANRIAVHEDNENASAQNIAAEYRAAFERGLQHALTNSDKINAVFAAPAKH